MKKTSLTLIIIFICTIIHAQNIPQLKLTPQGVEPIVVQVDSLKAVDMYKKSLNWVQETYKNPDKVLKAKIENEKIRIDGFAQNAWWYKTLGMKMLYDMEYSVEITFKDGKYKLEYTVGNFTNAGATVYYDYKSFFKKTGETRSMYTDAVTSLEKTMNDLSISLNNYITGKTAKKADNW